MKRIDVTLYRLGVYPNYVGYQEIRLAIRLTLEEPERLTALVRRVYTPVGQESGKNWTAVERNLRTVVRRAWETNPAYVTEIAGRPMDGKPETGEFLAMMYAYLSEEESKNVT